MRTITIEKDIYTFDELNDEAKQKAIGWYREGNLDYDWWEFCFEDVKRVALIIGITIDNIYFSGFSSQGDGACFEGFYIYQKGSVKAIKEYAPEDDELHKIADNLYQLQKRNFYRLSANVKHSGFYNHENCTIIDVSKQDEFYVNDEAESGIKEYLRDFMRWIYGQLGKEFDWLNSDESIIENIKANEYEFTENGKLYY